MRTLACVILATVLLAGCASFEEAYYVDREFGQAQMMTWDSQVAYPDYRHVPKTPEGTDGITAEEIMDVHNQTFGERPEDVDVLQFGLED